MTITPGDGGDGGTGGTTPATGGSGGDGGDGSGGAGGGAGTVIGGNSGGGTGGSAGSGGVAGTGGGAGTSGIAGTGGRGGTGGGGTGGGVAGTGGGGTGGGVAGTGGRGGTGGTAGTGGTGGGTAGTGGAGGRGGSGGTAGTGGSGGTGGTGGAGATGVLPTVAGQLVITEVMHNTAGIGNEVGEWFEVYNPSATVTYDLRTCQVDDIMPPAGTGSAAVAITSQVLVPPGAFRALAISSTPGFVPAYVYGTVRFDNDAAEQVNLICNGTLIDRFPYGDFDATDPLGTGKSFQLDPDFYTAAGNDLRTNWCYGSTVYLTTNAINEYGTPGMPNVQCP